MVAISMGKELQQRFFGSASIGPLYSMMHMNMSKNVKVAKGISKRNEMPLQSILEVKVFYCWGVDFVGPFPSSLSNEYILVVVIMCPSE